MSFKVSKWLYQWFLSNSKVVTSQVIKISMFARFMPLKYLFVERIRITHAVKGVVSINRRPPVAFYEFHKITSLNSTETSIITTGQVLSSLLNHSLDSLGNFVKRPYKRIWWSLFLMETHFSIHVTSSCLVNGHVHKD